MGCPVSLHTPKSENCADVGEKCHELHMRQPESGWLMVATFSCLPYLSCELFIVNDEQ